MNNFQEIHFIKRHPCFNYWNVALPSCIILKQSNRAFKKKKKEDERRKKWGLFTIMFYFFFKVGFIKFSTKKLKRYKKKVLRFHNNVKFFINFKTTQS